MTARKPDSLGRGFAPPQNGSIHRTTANAARESRVSTRAETTRKVFWNTVRAWRAATLSHSDGRGAGSGRISGLYSAA